MQSNDVLHGGAKRFIKSLLGFSIPTWVNFLISTIAAIILTRVFDPENYGSITIFTTTTEFGMALLCLGMDSGCLRFYNSPPNNESCRTFMFKTITSCILIVVIVSLPICLFCPIWFSKVVFGFENSIITVALAINVFCSTILRFFGISYRMNMKTKEYGIQTILTNTVKKLGYIVAIFISPDALTAIILQVFLLFVTVIVYFAIEKKDILPDVPFLQLGANPKKYYRGYGDFFLFSVYSAPNYLIQYANTLACLQILRVVCGDVAVGIYSTTSYFTAALTVMRGGFGTFWAPYMYQNYGEKQKTIAFVHGIWMVFSSVCFLCLVLGRNLIYLLVGSDFSDGREVVLFVLLGSLLQACMETTVYGIYIAKKTHIGLIVHALQMVVCIGISWALAYPLNILGVALGNMVSNVFYFGVSSYYGQKYYKSINKPLRTVYTVIVLVLEALLAYYFNFYTSAIICCLLTLSICFVYKDECRKTISFLLSIVFERHGNSKVNDL